MFGAIKFVVASFPANRTSPFLLLVCVNFNRLSKTSPTFMYLEPSLLFSFLMIFTVFLDLGTSLRMRPSLAFQVSLLI